MKTICLDFETYFDRDYTLKKMTTEHYIREQRFQALLLGVQDESGAYWLMPHEIQAWCDKQDWADIAVIAHHAHFDGLILSHHYGARPAFWFDTLCMARLLVGNHVSVALSSLAKHFELGSKSVPYDEFMGRRAENIPADLYKALGEGCLQDIKLTIDLFNRFRVEFPPEEYRVIDMTIRMFTEPTIVGDTETFCRVQREEWEHKGELLDALGVCEADLQSAARFVELLREEGIEPEYKDGKNGPTPAVAKTDGFIKGLLEDDNERIAALAQARLDVRSTIDETRAGRLAGMAGRGAMPVYLIYCGAHTTRWSGGDKVNFQNFPRGGDLRKALQAPDGWKLAVIDLSQIECRVLNYVAGQMDIVEAFATGRDLYSEGASRFYGRPINKKDNPTERHLGKVLELGCGYGMGANKLQSTCRAGALGGAPILLEPHEAQTAIQTYRQSHPKVTEYWKQGDDVLLHMNAARADAVLNWGPLKVCKGKIILPNNAPIFYELRWAPMERQWQRRTRKGWVGIWGGTLVENVVQAMARVVMSQAMIKMTLAGYKIALTTHDEVVVLVRNETAAEDFAKLVEIMRAEPEWLPGIPLDAEGGYADRYEK